MINILIGVISGIVSGSGMGGGTILILCLSLFVGLEQHVAQATNLVFFIPTSVAAIFINIKQKIIDWKLAIPISICGIIGAIIGANISTKMDVSLLKRFFGIFLGFIAVFQIYEMVREYRISKKTHNNFNLNKLRRK